MVQVEAAREGRRTSCKAVAWSSDVLRVVPGMNWPCGQKSATKGLTGFVLSEIRLECVPAAGVGPVAGLGRESVCSRNIVLAGSIFVVCLRTAGACAPAGSGFFSGTAMDWRRPTVGIQCGRRQFTVWAVIGSEYREVRWSGGAGDPRCHDTRIRVPAFPLEGWALRGNRATKRILHPITAIGWGIDV